VRQPSRRAGPFIAALLVLATGHSVSAQDDPPPGRFATPPAGQEAATTGERVSATPAPSRFGAPDPDPAYGAFQRGLFLTARNLALPRAEAGDAAAQTLLAEIYARGLGVAVDFGEARKWYAQAARQGVPEAQLQLALTLLAQEQGSEEARALMKSAADAGHGKAMFNHAQIVLSDRPGASGQRAAFEYFRRAAEAGIADAQYAVAQYYVQGTPPVFFDETEARQWMEKAARQGFDSAQRELGLMLLEGSGGPRDRAAGYLWTARAAHGGNVAAQAQIAKLLWSGIGVAPDDTQAAAWYVVARRAGLRDPVLEDFWLGLSPQMQQEAISRANRLRVR
jgi:TPR repeat protein